MSKKITCSLGNTTDYSEYIKTIRSIVKQNQADHARLTDLKDVAQLEESRLQHYVHNLKHIQELQVREYEQWQSKAKLFALQQKELESLIEDQSKSLAVSKAVSKAELEHGLRMINLMPNSKAEDYLSNTGILKSANENLYDDWLKVGQQLASSLFKNIEVQK